MRLLIDGDILCYRVGFACEKEKDHVAIQTMRSTLHDLYSNASLFSEITSSAIFLSGDFNFREEIAITAPYKGNRDGKAKPTHLLVLRDYLTTEWGASISINQEADDDIAIEASKDPSNSIICSIDKDFLQVSTWHFNFVKQQFFSINPEDGMLWFYRQILIGDRIDNIIGAEGIGDKKSMKLLEGLDEPEMYQVCVDILGEDRVLENGSLLWLRREEGQKWPNVDFESANRVNRY